MKLIDMSCPNCGAKLKINEESKKASCEFCGADLILDDEVKHIRVENAEELGYEFEKGRQRAKEEIKNTNQITNSKIKKVSEKNNKGKFLGPFYCILAAVVWGLSFVAQSEGASIGTFTFNGLRTLLGGIVLIPLVIFSHVKDNKKLPDGDKKKFAFKEVIIGGFCCGLALFAGGNLQQHAFFLDLGPGKVGFITALYMVLVPIAGIFMKRKLRFNIWLGVALGVVGLYLLSVPAGNFSIGKGEIIAICGAFAFAAHILVIDHFCKKVNNIALSCAQFFVAGILSIICMFIFEEPNIEAIKGAGVQIAYAGIMSCGVAFTAQIFGQKYSNPTVASVLLCLESVFAVIFGWLLLGDKLGSREAIGCVIMFTAIMLTQIPTEAFLKIFRKKSQK